MSNSPVRCKCAIADGMELHSLCPLKESLSYSWYEHKSMVRIFTWTASVNRENKMS